MRVWGGGSAMVVGRVVCTGLCDEEEEDLCGERGQPCVRSDCAASATARAAWGTE